LSAIQHLNQSRPFQVENVSESERAFEGAKLRYQAGSVDFLTLLEAQKTLYAAAEQLIQYKLARLQALVSLCKRWGEAGLTATALSQIILPTGISIMNNNFRLRPDRRRREPHCC